MKTTFLLAVMFCCIQVNAAVFPVRVSVAITTKKAFTSSFSFIRGHKQGRNTTVTWGMTSNSGINHFIVECTYEDPTDPYSVWQDIGVMPCTNSPIFKFVDAPVLPGTLNYRIIAVMNDNSTITSGIYTTYIL